MMDNICLLLGVAFLICVTFRGINANSNIEYLVRKKAHGSRPFQGHKVVRVFPVKTSEVDYIDSLEFNPDIEVDFWSRSRSIDIHVGPEDYEKLDGLLKRSNINFNILIDNLQTNLDEEAKAHYRHSKGWHGDYHTYEEIIQKINNLANTFNTRATVLNIGKTYENRDIIGLEVTGSKQIPNKQKAVMICGQHAREWIAPATCMYMMEEILKRYGQDANITAMVDRFNWVIFPIVNPDGYAYCWSKEGNRLWRKNRQPNVNSTCHGTDLNRNWAFKWAGRGSSDYPCSEIYHGNTPFSAQETKAISEYVKSNRENIFSFIDIHSYSQLWMYPWSYTVDELVKDKDELQRVSRLSVASLKAKHSTDFQAGPAGIIIYEASGSGKDWSYGEMGVKYAFALELRDKGAHGFFLPKEQIIPSGEEVLAAFQSLAPAMNDYAQKTTAYYTKRSPPGNRL